MHMGVTITSFGGQEPPVCSHILAASLRIIMYHVPVNPFSPSAFLSHFCPLTTYFGRFTSRFAGPGFTYMVSPIGQPSKTDKKTNPVHMTQNIKTPTILQAD